MKYYVDELTELAVNTYFEDREGPGIIQPSRDVRAVRLEGNEVVLMDDRRDAPLARFRSEIRDGEEVLTLID